MSDKHLDECVKALNWHRSYSPLELYRKFEALEKENQHLLRVLEEEKTCNTCKHAEVSLYKNPCTDCLDGCNWGLKEAE